VALVDAPMILFVDADVVVHADTVQLAQQTLLGNPGLGACFGSYDEQPDDPGFLSQFRNLYHRWVHQNARTDASTFWTGCGAVRRVAFDEAGGFSEVLSRLGMEDIDLGYRMRDAGYGIELVKSMNCTHLKAWRLGSMVRTDVFHRGVPWMLLLLARDDAPADLNLDSTSRLCTLFGGVLPGALAAGFVWPPIWAVAAVAGIAIAYLQRGFLGYVRRLRGLRFSIAAVPALWLFYACAAVSVPLALWRHVTGRGLKGRLATPAQDGIPDS
jgi:cellulose synthase/poly-beta-1,6-N-acetylglucosamine synthase-like glycosyltransferase